MDIHRAGLTVEVETPGFLQDLLAAEHQSAVLDECEQKVELLGAQVEALRGETDLTPGRVDGQIAEVGPAPDPPPSKRARRGGE